MASTNTRRTATLRLPVGVASVRYGMAAVRADADGLVIVPRYAVPALRDLGCVVLAKDPNEPIDVQSEIERADSRDLDLWLRSHGVTMRQYGHDQGIKGLIGDEMRRAALALCERLPGHRAGSTEREGYCA